MYLENLVVDSLDPQSLGRWWEAAVGGETLTDDVDIFETRLSVPGGPDLDLCFQPVAEAASEPSRLRVVLAGPLEERADPEGNPFEVTDETDETGVVEGPVAALRLESADPERDAAFWAWLTGWDAASPTSLRHPSGHGPVLELVPESAPKAAGAKNRMHLDVRLEPGDDPAALAQGIAGRGGRELSTDWGDLPWTSYQDPSGNEVCLLPARQ